MVIIAIANGALRQPTFGKVIPELRAHQILTAKGFLSKRSGKLPSRVMKVFDDGLRLVLSL